ncbi:hypothetical protein Tco_0682003 [Tanacetum coccineum]|uniref:Uncharacterized protein n=1 Tax=Tanacetum coccineum TaxID=301880 RepID=A0ABQ4XQ71_9ASTR
MDSDGHSLSNLAVKMLILSQETMLLNVDQLQKQLDIVNSNLYDSIKKTRVQTKNHNDSLIDQMDEKSIENADLKAHLQEKVFAIAALKNELRKLKGNSVDTKFASQVDVKNDLSKPVTQHYFPKGREFAFSKPHHMITSSKSRNSSKNMPRFSSNDMVHNHYLDEARKKTQERNRNSKPSVMHTTCLQNTTKDSKPKLKSNNQTSRSLPTSKSSCVTITVVTKADHSRNTKVNSHAKVQSNKTRNSNKPVEQKSHTQKPGRKIFIGHRFSPNKTSAVYEKTSPRSYLRWKPTGRIFKTASLRWIPTGKLFDSCMRKADSTSINVPKEHSFDLNACTSYNVKQDDLRVWLLKKLIS